MGNTYKEVIHMKDIEKRTVIHADPLGKVWFIGGVCKAKDFKRKE